MDEQELQKLYGAMSNHFDVGSFDEFKSKMGTPEDRQKFYKVVSDKGMDLGDYNTYETRLAGSPEKKNQVGSQNGSNISATSSDNGLSGTPKDEKIPVVDLSQNREPSLSTPEGNRPVSDNPIDLSLYSDELSRKEKDISVNPESGAVNSVPDQESIDYSKKLDDELKGKGYNSKELAKDFKDFPQAAFDMQNTSKEHLLQLKQDNPVEYQRVLNDTKTVYNIAKNTDNHTANLFNSLNSGQYNSLGDFINGKQKQIDIIDHSLTGDERDIAKQRLAQNAAPYINANNPDLQSEYDQSDLKNHVDVNQYAGLKTMQLFEPEKYKQAIDILNTKINPEYTINAPTAVQGGGQATTTDKAVSDKMGGKLSQGTIDQQIGQETILKQLSSIGRDNAVTQLNHEQYNLDNAFKNTQDEAQKEQIRQQYIANQSKINDLQKDAQQDDARFPLTAKLKFDNQVKELTGSAGQGALEYGTNRFVKGFANTGNSIEDMAIGLFGSDKANTELQMKRLGEAQGWQSNQYLPENLKGDNSDFILQPSKELKTQADAILKGRDLSELPYTDKQKIFDIVKNNQDQIKSITNPDAGKSKNFFSKSTLYSSAGFLGDIGSIVAQTYGLGALGAGKAVSSIAPMVTTSYSDFFNQATAEGKSPSEASQFAAIHSGILGLAGAINPDIDIVKRALGANSAAGKFVAGISEDTWNKVLSENKPVYDRLKSAITSVGKETAKMGATYGVGTSIASDLADKGFFDKKITPDEMLDHAIKSTKDIIFGSAGLLGVNFLTHLTKGVPIQEKSMLWELGDNPEIGKAKIDEAVQRGELSQEQGDQRKKVIQDVSGLINKVPTENSKGKPLTDDKKVEYLYNLFIQNKLKSEKSDLPKTQAENAEHESLVANFKNDLLIENPTDKQLESRTKTLENFIAPKTDAEGKSIEIPEQEKKNAIAQIQAIKEHLDNRSTAMSQKVEGIDQSTGIPDKAEAQPKEGSGGVGGDVVKEEINNERGRLEKNIKDEEDYISKNKPKGVLGKVKDFFLIKSRFLENQKADLQLLNENPEKYFEQALKGELDWKKKYPNDENLIEYYSGVIDKIKTKPKAVEQSLKETPEQPLKENTPEEELTHSLNKYDNEENYTIGDLVNDVQGLALDHKESSKLMDAVEEYRKEEQDDWDLKGRGEMALAADNFEKKIRSIVGEQKEAIPEKKASGSLDFSKTSKEDILKILTTTNDNEEFQAVQKELKRRGSDMQPLKDIPNTENKKLNINNNGTNTQTNQVSNGEEATGTTASTSNNTDNTNTTTGSTNGEPPIKEENKTTDNEGQATGTAEQLKAKVSDLGEKLKTALKAKGIKDTYVKMGVGIDEVVDFAVNKIHAAIDAGKAIVDAVKEGMDHIRNSDWYKSLTSQEKLDTDELLNSHLNEVAQQKEIGTKKALNDKLREEMGLKPLDLPKHLSKDEQLVRGKQLVDSGKNNPLETINYLLDNKDNPNAIKLSPDDELGMIYYTRQLDAERTDLTAAKIDLEDKVKNEPDNEGAKMDLSTVKQKLLNNYDAEERRINASQIGGNVWSKSGYNRQLAVDEKGQVINSINRIKTIYGDDIPEHIKTQLTELQIKNDELLAKNAKIEKEARDAQAENELLKQKLEAKNKKGLFGTKRAKKTDAEFAKERADIIEKMRADLLKTAKGGGGTFATVPLAPQLKAIAPHITALVRNLAEQGANKLDDVLTSIHSDIKDVVNGITKDDIRDIIAGKYNDTTTKTELAKRVSDLQTQAKITNRIKEVTNNIEREVKEKGEQSPEVKRLKKELSELKTKKGLEKKISDLENGIVAAKKTKGEQSDEVKELQKRLAELKSETSLKKKISDLENGISSETKVQGEKSANVKALQKTLAELKKRSVNEFADLSTEEIKKQIEATKNRINKGDFVQTPFVKRKWEKDVNWIKNNQELTNIKRQLRDLEYNAMQSQKSKYMRALDWGNRWGRRVIFFGANAVYTKLSSAAVLGSFVHRPFEQVMGKVNKFLYPHIAAQAPVEGFINMAAEVKFYSEFLNPIKFAKNTWDIGKTGGTKLSRELDNKPSHTTKNHIPILDLFAADSHQMIKDPVKRATFEAAFMNTMKYYAENNLDGTHPLLLEAARQGAYKTAEYEIFQNSAKKAGMVSKFFNELEKSGVLNNAKPDVWSKVQGNAQYTLASLYHFFVPINTVPLNIMKRIGLGISSPITMVKAWGKNKAIKDGIENLSQEDANLLMSQLKKGQVGMAYWTLGFILGGSALGGAYTGYYSDKTRKGLKSDEMKNPITGKEVPKNVQHNYQLQSAQMGATWCIVYSHYIHDKGASQLEAITAASAATAGSMLKQIPSAEEGMKVGNALIQPGQGAKFAKDLKRRVGVDKTKSAIENIKSLMGYGE